MSLFNLADLTVEELNMIDISLGKLPFEVVSNLIFKIRAQVAAQRTPRPTEVDPRVTPVVGNKGEKRGDRANTK